MGTVHRLKKAQPADPIFFNKEDVAVGSIFKYYGAMGHSTWRVKEITTLMRKDGDIKEQNTDTVRVITDVLHLTRLGTGETRRATFTYLRYSAIWRLT